MGKMVFDRVEVTMDRKSNAADGRIDREVCMNMIVPVYWDLHRQSCTISSRDIYSRPCLFVPERGVLVRLKGKYKKINMFHYRFALERSERM
jgi:hypothetical protein